MIRWSVWLIGWVFLLSGGVAHAQRLTAVCAADCNRDCTVGIDELGASVSSALEQTAASTCDYGDVNGDGEISIEELVAGVDDAAGGCTLPPCQPPRRVELEPSDNDQDMILGALIDAQPGDEIFLKAGTYHLTGQLSLDVDDVTLRGEGMDKTILSFANQTTGAEGLLVTADRFVIEDIALEDSPGDLMKIIGAKGLTIRRVRTEWTNGASTENGSYGLYPVDCHSVLIEDSIVRGASDAGFYIGQSHGIIMRRNLAELNVAGYEVENCTDADVYDNIATKNTGGILVFNLPGLLFIDGRRTRVYSNQMFENNTPNFAPSGTTVAAVPKGTGLMILANDEVEVFDNDFRDNDTTNILLISFRTAQLVGDFNNTDPNYDEFSESIYIHDNRYIGGGADPEDAVAELLMNKLGPLPFPQILFDGFVDRAKLEGGVLPGPLRICIQDPTATFSNLQLNMVIQPGNPDPEPFNCSHPALPVVRIPGLEVPEEPTPTATPTMPEVTPTPTATAIQEARCRVPPGTGVNVDPTDTSCQFLSSYRFFTGNMAEQIPNQGVVPYDLNTALFSDYTAKDRFVFVPPGKQATYNATESFDFPVGSVLIKSFTYPADLRDPAAGGDLLETRLLVRQPSGWVGLPYVWNAQKTDAVLRSVGATLQVSGIGTDGNFGQYSYKVPNSNQCKECHREHHEVMGLLGPKARHLNKDYPYADGAENQLTHWADLGILAGAPADPSAAERAAVFDDPSTGNTEQRARAYLDINCAHCHNQTGAARTTGLYLTYDETDPGRLGVCKSPTAAGQGTGNLPYVVNPGHASESILSFRMRSTEPQIAMPELGRTRVHNEALDLIDDWINALEGSCAIP